MKYLIKTNVAEVLSKTQFADNAVKNEISSGFLHGLTESIKVIIDKTPRRKATMVSGPEAGWEGVLQASIAGEFASVVGVSYSGGDPMQYSLTKINQNGPEIWDGQIGVSSEHPYAYYVEFGNAEGGSEIIPKIKKVMHWEDEARGEVFAHKVSAYPPFGMFSNSLPEIQTIVAEEMDKALAKALEK